MFLHLDMQTVSNAGLRVKRNIPHQIESVSSEGHDTLLASEWSTQRKEDEKGEGG